MAVSQVVQFASVADLWLDPTNPRLGRRNTNPPQSQSKLLDLMRAWNLEELATSFAESGFWTQEAVIVVREKRDRGQRFVVVEGNRRVAALKVLKAAVDGKESSNFWKTLAGESSLSSDLFARVPFYLSDSRDDIDSYLGFRHVTGIKQWDPAEKAEYIGRLVDVRGLTFDDIRRAIGSKTPTVRRNYIAYRMLLQFDALETTVPIENVEERFSVLYLALRESAVRRFLGISETAQETGLKRPVPTRKIQDLGQFAVWLFGTKTRPPLFSDSRRMSDFARALDNRDSVKYLRTARNASLDQALRHAGVELEDVLTTLRNATDEVEQALSRIHLYRDNDDVELAIDRFAVSANELIKKFGYTISQ